MGKKFNVTSVEMYIVYKSNRAVRSLEKLYK